MSNIKSRDRQLQEFLMCAAGDRPNQSKSSQRDKSEEDSPDKQCIEYHFFFIGFHFHSS